MLVAVKIKFIVSFIIIFGTFLLYYLWSWILFRRCAIGIMRASLQSITVLLTSLFVLLCLENQHPDRQPEHHRHVRVFLHSVVRYCRGGRYWYVAHDRRSKSELSMGPLCVTRSNPTHQLTDPTQPTTNGKIWTQPEPTQCN